MYNSTNWLTALGVLAMDVYVLLLALAWGVVGASTSGPKSITHSTLRGIPNYNKSRINNFQKSNTTHFDLSTAGRHNVTRLLHQPGGWDVRPTLPPGTAVVSSHNMSLNNPSIAGVYPTPTDGILTSWPLYSKDYSSSSSLSVHREPFLTLHNHTTAGGSTHAAPNSGDDNTDDFNTYPPLYVIDGNGIMQSGSTNRTTIMPNSGNPNSGTSSQDGNDQLYLNDHYGYNNENWLGNIIKGGGSSSLEGSNDDVGGSVYPHDPHDSDDDDPREGGESERQSVRTTDHSGGSQGGSTSHYDHHGDHYTDGHRDDKMSNNIYIDTRLDHQEFSNDLSDDAPYFVKDGIVYDRLSSDSDDEKREEGEKWTKSENTVQGQLEITDHDHPHESSTYGNKTGSTGDDSNKTGSSTSEMIINALNTEIMQNIPDMQQMVIGAMDVAKLFVSPLFPVIDTFVIPFLFSRSSPDSSNPESTSEQTCVGAGSGAYAAFCQRRCGALGGMANSDKKELSEHDCRDHCAKNAKLLCSKHKCEEYGCIAKDCGQLAPLACE